MANQVKPLIFGPKTTNNNGVPFNTTGYRTKTIPAGVEAFSVIG